MSTIKSELPNILKAFKSHQGLLDHNFKLQRVLNDDLLGVLEDEAIKFNSAQARRDNKNMAVSLNYLIKIVEHQSQLYTFEVKRTPNKNKELVDQYLKLLNLDTHLHNANKLFNGSKTVLVEIYQDRKNDLKVRPIANDKFFVYSNDIYEPNRPTHFIKVIGEYVNKENKADVLLHIYTDAEFMAVLASGEIIEDEQDNIFGVAPFVYVTKEVYKLMPTPARDCLQVIIQLCNLLTNALVSIYYQGHPVRILRNVDITSSKISINPDDYVILNSKENSELNPELTELESSLDVSQTLNIYESLLNHLLHINGLKAKDANTSHASGVALQLKDNDIIENRKDQIEQWRPADQEFWEKLALCHNAIMDKKIAGPKTPTGKFDADFTVETEFPLPDTNLEVIENAEDKKTDPVEEK